VEIRAKCERINRFTGQTHRKRYTIAYTLIDRLLAILPKHGFDKLAPEILPKVDVKPKNGPAPARSQLEGMIFGKTHADGQHFDGISPK